MMTGIRLRAFAVRLVAQATRAQEQGKLSGRYAELKSELSVAWSLVGPKTESRVRLELACRKRAALSVDCMRISLGMLVFELLESFRYASIAVLGTLLLCGI